KQMQRILMRSADDKMGKTHGGIVPFEAGIDNAMHRDDATRNVCAPQTGCEARRMIRLGVFARPTSGRAPGYVQGNLVILPNALAADFLQFCQLNPKPCPLIAVSSPGEWQLSRLADDLDIRTDLPRYRVWRHGAIVDEPQDILRWW